MTPRRKRMIAAIVAAFYIAGIVFAVEAAMKVRTAQGAVAWSVSLVSFPFVAVPAYLVLGRSKFEGMSEAFESRRDEFERLLADIKNKLDPWEIPPGEGPSWHAAMTRLSGMQLTRGNRVDLLINGESTFDSILAGVAEAERVYVFMCSMMRLAAVVCQRSIPRNFVLQVLKSAPSNPRRERVTVFN